MAWEGQEDSPVSPGQSWLAPASSRAFISPQARCAQGENQGQSAAAPQAPAHGVTHDNTWHLGTQDVKYWECTGKRDIATKTLLRAGLGGSCHPRPVSLTLQQEASGGLGRKVVLPDFPAHPVPAWGEEMSVQEVENLPTSLPAKAHTLFPQDFVFSPGKEIPEHQGDIGRDAEPKIF